MAGTTGGRLLGWNRFTIIVFSRAVCAWCRALVRWQVVLESALGKCIVNLLFKAIRFCNSESEESPFERHGCANPRSRRCSIGPQMAGPYAQVDHLWDTNGQMPSRNAHPLDGEMLQGTLDLLVLQTLVLGPAHGHTIAHLIEQRSEEVLQIEHGSLYPALHRLEDRGWMSSFWGTSENNRKARYYKLTAAGHRQLLEHTSRWDRLVRAVNRVLRPAEE